MNFGSAGVQGAPPIKSASREGIECRHGRPEQVSHPIELSLPERAEMAKVSKRNRGQNLRRCTQARVTRGSTGDKGKGQ
jgi:hypothetical protein